MPISEVQNADVQPLLGSHGRLLRGALVKHSLGLGPIVEYKTTFSNGRSDIGKDRSAKEQADAEHTRVRERARRDIVFITAKAMRDGLRNPSSAEWVSVFSNEDASAICVILRAQNGFGGMNVEYYAVIDGKIGQSSATWNKHCANKKLYDMTQYVRTNL